MKKISLVVPTINRIKELDELLNSIKNQNYENLEVIIVDQNRKLDLEETIFKYASVINIIHKKVKFRGASQARNYGIKIATGEIINFPDDDCVFEKELLHYINEYFENSDEIAVFGKVTDEQSSEDILRFKNRDCRVSFGNVYNTTIEASMFIYLEELKKIGMFDERLGLGEIFGAEEGADLICRLLYKKKKMKFVAKTFFYHPSKREYTNFKRAFSYNMGFAGFIHKHIYELKRLYPSIIYWNIKQMKNMLRLISGWLKKDSNKVKYQLYCYHGRRYGKKEWKKRFCNIKK